MRQSYIIFFVFCFVLFFFFLSLSSRSIKEPLQNYCRATVVVRWWQEFNAELLLQTTPDVWYEFFEAKQQKAIFELLPPPERVL